MLTVAFCTFKRADRLEKLVTALRAQSCPVPFEILAVNNNSPDNTLDVLGGLQQQHGASLRVVTETAPGIVPARNRALSESQSSDYLVFIDDDEMPHPGLLDAAYDALVSEGAQCVGGRIEIDYSPHARPAWLDAEISGFLGQLDHGPDPFWISSSDTPIWSGNTAYAMHLFRDYSGLRFDTRYNREGEGIGGGEDAAMLHALLATGTRIRYRPDMAVWHSVDPWKLKRRYFLKLHYLAGIRQARFHMPNFPRTLLGVPPFLISQLFGHCLKTLSLLVTGKDGLMRQAMNVSHSWGNVVGYTKR